MACTKQHRYDPQYNNLPIDQGGAGRHRCAGCAYCQLVYSKKRYD